MKRYIKFVMTVILVAFIIPQTFSSANAKIKNPVLKNKFFSITLPEQTKGIYKAKIKKDSILLYDKKSKRDGFGGFAFGVKLYKNPSDHAMIPGGQKIGELIDKRSNLYDVVLLQPTDVQYDYTKQTPNNYKFLYDLAKTVEIKGINGSDYYKNQGMKGKNLYKEVLKKHITAIKEKWDSNRLEKENMSYMYNAMSAYNSNVLDKVGYAYYDTNGDGIEELLIGEIAKGAYKGVIYDIYTMKDRNPIHVVSGGARDRYYVCDDVFICREYSSGANENGVLVYILVENSSELFPQVGFKYDGYENKKNPWFITYDIPKDKWENVSKEKYAERKSTFEKYERFDFTPLSKVFKKQLNLKKL